MARLCTLTLCVLIFAASTLVNTKSASAHDPFDPKVSAMVTKALKYLTRTGDHPIGKETGGMCLIAYTIIKAYKYESNRTKNRALVNDVKTHPQVVKAVKLVQAQIKAGPQPGKGEWKELYMACMATILLCELDDQKYKKDINWLIKYIVGRQNEQGFWGYHPNRTGDTSQSQYCTLALWLAKNKGFRVSNKVVGKALGWFLKSQRGNGGFVYKPGVSGPSVQGSTSGSTTLSMSAGGMGSVYILEDILRGARQDSVAKKRKKLENFKLPPTVTVVPTKDELEEAAVADAPVALPNTSAAKSRGIKFFKDNFQLKYDTPWKYYFLYGMERYESFREKDEGNADAEPEWYNRGVDFLEGNQTRSGAWAKENNLGSESAATCFAVLFLIRSTKTTLPPVYESGELGGGQGLAEDVKLALHGNSIVSGKISRNVDQLFSSLEQAGEEDLSKLEATLGAIEFSKDPKKRTEQMATMRSMVSHEKYQARLIAVRALGKMRDFDSVPILIYALSDPNLDVARVAHDSLRFISRKFETIKVPKIATKSDFAEARVRWKTWYKSLYPDAVFRNTDVEQVLKK